MSPPLSPFWGAEFADCARPMNHSYKGLRLNLFGILMMCQSVFQEGGVIYTPSCQAMLSGSMDSGCLARNPCGAPTGFLSCVLKGALRRDLWGSKNGTTCSPLVHVRSTARLVLRRLASFSPPEAHVSKCEPGAPGEAGLVAWARWWEAEL